jgi:hypothetical protein
MLKFLDPLKYRLSHISAKSLVWRAVKYIFGRKAKGKACTFYWFKLPVSLLALAGLMLLYAIVYPLTYFCRTLAVTCMWLFGRNYNGRFFSENAGTTKDYNYNDYKERSDGSKFRFAPWEIALVLVAGVMIWLFGFVNPRAGLGIVLWATVVAAVIGLMYLLSAAWKSGPIARARAAVKAAYDRACPPLVVEEPEPEAELFGM